MSETPTSKPPTVICFDWGGVILRICRSWEEGCKHAGLPVRAGSDDPRMKQHRHELAERYQIGELDCEAFCHEVAKTTDALYTPDEIGRIHDAWLIAEYTGADALVERVVRAPHLRTGLLSNTNKRHYARHTSARDGAEPDFPTIGKLAYHVASHEVGASKPGEAIYRAFEDLTGARGDDIVFFDDLTENVQTARDLGWRAVQIDHTGNPPAQIERALADLGVEF